MRIGYRARASRIALGLSAALAGCSGSDPVSPPAPVVAPPGIGATTPPGATAPAMEPSMVSTPQPAPGGSVPTELDMPGAVNGPPAVNSERLLPCDVADVLTRYCAECHGTILQGGAPLSLITAFDFQAVREDGLLIGDRVLARVQDDTRPMPPPPKPRMTAEEVAILQRFVAAGSQPAVGGCPVQEPEAPPEDTTQPIETPAGGRPTTSPADLAAGANWTVFGHDLENSRANTTETELSPMTVSGLRRHWQFMGAASTSTPAVVDGVVYLPTWDGKIHGFQLADGNELWATELPNLVDSSVAVSETQIFVGDNMGFVHALDRATGALQWTQQADSHPHAHLWSSPVYIADPGLVVVGVASGEESVLGPYTFRGSVAAFDAASGAMAWQFYTTENDSTSGPGVAVWGTVAVDTTRKAVYVGTGNTYAAPTSPLTDSLLALDYTTGELQWSHQFTEADVFTVVSLAGGPDFDLGSTANLFSVDGKDLVGIGIKSGTYCALDRDTGTVEWVAQLTRGSVLGGVISASAYAEGVVYVASNRFSEGLTDVVSLNTSDGSERWRVTLSSVTYGGVAYANGVVYIANDSATVVALDAASGEELWTDKLPNATAASPVVADGRLLVPWGYQWTLGRGAAGRGGLIAYGQ